jgi:REP element-mobilizing transposase RayT
MSRGNEGHDIFFHDDDRNYFLGILEKYVSQNGYLVYAWVLLSNHYHLVVRINENPLGVFMRNINGQYAQYIRKKLGKKGHVFQDRYKSIVVQDQLYLEQLIRYVHLNPIRAGLCHNISELNRYKWCGHRILMGKQSCKFQNTVDVLKRFDKSPTVYRDFIKQGLKIEDELYNKIRSSNHNREDIRNTGCWVIGNSEFVSNAMKRVKDSKIINSRSISDRKDINEVVNEVCDSLHIKEQEEVKWRGKDNIISHARKIISYMSCRLYRIPVRNLAVYFAVNPSSISRMIKDGEVLYKKYGFKQ